MIHYDHEVQVPTRKPRAAKPKEAELELVPDAPEEDSPQPEEAPQAVVVIKVVDADGNIATDVQPINGLQPTEVQTLLELGIGSWRAKIGLDKST